MMTRHFLLLALTVSGVALGQDSQPQAQLPSGQPLPGGQVMPSNGPGSAPWKGMTVKEKLRYDAKHLFDVDNIIFAGIGAAFDQGRDRPGQWGEGWGPFFGRYGSHFGQYLVQRSIMYPTQAIDHEDTRYLRSSHVNVAARTGDAFLHTIWRAKDNGGMMPAYSELLGDYGAAAVSRMWWPDKYHTGSAIFIAGSDTILIDGAINVFHEFTPDIKHFLHLHP